MLLIYFVYGLSFSAAGLLLGFQALLPASVLARTPLVCLALFGAFHGLCEWAKMAQGLMPSPHASAWGFVVLTLLVVSFALLMQFGLEVLSTLGRVAAWTKTLPAGLALIALAVGIPFAAADATHLRSAEAAARYAFGLPGSLLAALALIAMARKRHQIDLDGAGRWLPLAAGVFVSYAIVAGVLVPSAPFFPAAWLNAEAFFAVTGVRVEITRAACAVIVAALLSKAFVVESAKEHAQWERHREEFISVVAHDLRSPVGAISLGAETLERQLLDHKELDVDRSIKILRHIISSAKRLARMVADLVDVSRIDARRLTIEPQSVELRSLVQGIVDRAAAVTAGHPVKTVLPESVPAVRVDPARVEQVLENLLSNAAKYSSPESEIRVEAFARDAEVELAVTSAGEGLAQEECAKLFTRFYRGTKHSDQEGLGLGLYIAKGLVEAQGGRIWADSERGKHTTFHFTLPRAVSQRPTLPTAS